MGYEMNSLLSVQGLAAPFHTAVPDSGFLYLASPLFLGGTFIVPFTGGQLELCPVGVQAAAQKLRSKSIRCLFKGNSLRLL